MLGVGYIFRPNTNHFHMDGVPLTFEYPGSWTINTNAPVSFGHGQVIALIGNVPCPPEDSNCLSQFADIEPGEIEVSVVVANDVDICTLAQHPISASDGGDRSETTYFLVDGFPAIDTEIHWVYDPHWGQVAHDERRLSIAGPEIGDIQRRPALFSITARFRDAYVAGLRSMLDRLVASLHVDGSVPPGDDCGAPFPPAG